MNEKQKIEKSVDYQIDPLLIATKFILDFYYGDVSLETISSFTPNKDNGFDSSSVVTVVSNLGLHAIERDMKGTEIPDYFLPCIIIDNFCRCYLTK